MLAKWASRTGYDMEMTSQEDMSSGSRGFTIVELLIVVVVIAILAAITIVSYNGITSRASATALQTDLAQANKILSLYYLSNNTYPADLPAAIDAGVRASNDTVFSYSMNSAVSPHTYALTASNGKTSYYISSQGQTSPTSGAWITNYVANPGFETSATANWGTFWAPGRARDTSQARSGAASLLMTQVTTGTQRGDGIVMPATGLPDIQEGATYRASFWFRAPAGTYVIGSLKFNTGAGGRSSKYVNGNGAWQRVELDPYVAVSADVGNVDKLRLQVIMTSSGNSYVTPAAGVQVNIDDVMFQVTPPGQLSVPSAYSDGDNTNAGWLWNGAQATSSSQGPTI